MLDMNMLGPSAIVFFVFFLTGIAIERSSGRKTAQRQREAWMQRGGIPDHAWVDDSPSFGASLLAVLFWFIGAYIITAMLFFHSNPLWVFTL